MTAKIVTFGNFKGGTGKTTNSAMIGNELANQGYKTLLVDLDPQANATSLYLLTKQRLEGEIVKFDKTLMSAIADGDLSEIVLNVKENLFLLPSFADFTSYPLFLEKKFPDSQFKRVSYLSELLEPLKEKFDFILIDVPPTLSTYTDSALYGSDYTIIVLQTHERSLVGAEAYVKYLQELIDSYNADFDILGVLPVLLKNNAAVDLSTLENATASFGESNMFQTVVKNMERLKRYDLIGIVDVDKDDSADMHDRRVAKLYSNVTQEFLDRLSKKEEV
ncbi:ParA family protein [Listeria fleischmannii]|uniref:AAA family ATPase n=1 Tax=Listeria fleischmannii TaxID=1069827 RepID=A0A841YI82_9LIST|nr:AAA family ATPase [Listeria fleischmannii]MBC1399930.1 AAA family ATPase [Listeria fleischmannii]MBC1419917.1 AAA family ATPase [Listeria fleischmannii]